MMETGREKIADTNTMLLPKPKAEKDTDCLSIYQSTVFFSLHADMMMTHARFEQVTWGRA